MSILLQPILHHALAIAATATPTGSPTGSATATLPPAPTGSSSTLDSLKGLLAIVVFFFVAFVVIFWLALVFWTWRDVRSRTQDTILQITATLLVAVFNLGGLFIYLIIRPRQTLAELYERQLEEESLLAEMTERQTCPTCHYRVDGDFQACPSCGTKLRRPCPRCERLLELKWNVCPYCGYGGGALDGGSRAPSRQGARMER
ncbi:MAG TPA: zinc ribbon domain-containing protein [Ktedonobacterales bacterium]|nr:zinc ribbon domain-containing protein [Ktedonobacterales bacterium]